MQFDIGASNSPTAEMRRLSAARYGRERSHDPPVFSSIPGRNSEHRERQTGATRNPDYRIDRKQGPREKWPSPAESAPRDKSSAFASRFPPKCIGREGLIPQAM